MKKYKTTGIAAALAAAAFSTGIVLMPTAARAQDSGEAASMFSSIIVQGSGVVQTKPDIARVMAGVQTRHNDAQKAADDNAQKMAAIIKAVRAAGIAEADIQTAGYNIYREYLPPPPGREGASDGREQPSVYVVLNNVNITVRKMADAGRVLDAAIKAGANQAGGITFDLNEAAVEKARGEALRKAVADARRKADAIASAAGVGTLTLHSIQEGGINFPRPMMDQGLTANVAMRAEAAQTTVAPGELAVTANITVRYRFTPKVAAASAP